MKEGKDPRSQGPNEEREGPRAQGPNEESEGPWNPFGGILRHMEAEGQLNGGLGVEPPGKKLVFSP